MDIQSHSQSLEVNSQSVRYTLPNFRFINFVRSFLFIDWASTVTLWLTGGHGDYFVDNILHFHFLESIFDLVILTTLRIIVLWIILSWLEDVYLSLIDEPYHQQLQFHKKILQVVLVVISFMCLVYVTTKGGFILYWIINEAHYVPMHLTYNLLAGSTVFFCLLEFVISLMCSVAFRKIADLLIEIKYPEDLLKTVNLKRLLKLAKEETKILVFGGITLCISSSSQMVAPLFFGKVVDAAQKSMEELSTIVLILLAIYVGGSITTATQTWLFNLAGQRIVANIRKDLFKAIIRQEIAFFDVNRTGELTNRLSSDTQVVQNALTLNMSMLLRYSLQVIGSIVLMFSLSPALTGVLLAVVPVISIGTVQYGKYVKSLRQTFQDELAAASATAEETISNIRTVRMFTSEDKSKRNYNNDVNKSYEIGKKMALVQGTFTGTIGLFAYGSITLVLWYGGKLLYDHTQDARSGITAGVLTSFLLYTLQVALAFAFLSNVYGDFMQAVGASIRIFDLMDRLPLVSNHGGFLPDVLKGGVIFKNVSFTYPARPDSKVLNNVSLQVDSGQVVAIVGPSGAGKTTIVNLIERFYDPDSGQILLGGYDLKILDPQWVRHKISIVSQEPILFACSIRDNIAYGRDAELDEITEVAIQANCHDFIMSFDQQYDTLVGERGVRLSGGQKQRVAIARALLMNPKILLLDEATSALDAESERLVQEAIDRAMKGRTVLVIAHRLSTVRNASQVIVIDHGQVVEAGTHDSLLQRDGVYKRLVYHQLAAGMTSSNLLVDVN